MRFVILTYLDLAECIGQFAEFIMSLIQSLKSIIGINDGLNPIAMETKPTHGLLNFDFKL
ncbi:MAG: hypothetical protein ACJA1A_001540 [Saprospiraceae bacterium]|jgi:hypothetical protein